MTHDQLMEPSGHFGEDGIERSVLEQMRLEEAAQFGGRVLLSPNNLSPEAAAYNSALTRSRTAGASLYRDKYMVAVMAQRPPQTEQAA